MDLLPVESIALTTANSVAERGEPIPPNVAVMLLLALNRLTNQMPTFESLYPSTERTS